MSVGSSQADRIFARSSRFCPDCRRRPIDLKPITEHAPWLNAFICRLQIFSDFR